MRTASPVGSTAPAQRLGTGAIGPGRQPDQHLVGRDEHVAPVDVALLDAGDGREPRVEVGPDRIGLAGAARGPGAQHDGVGADAQRRILDEHGVGVAGQLGHRLDGDGGGLERLAVALVLGEEPSGIGVGPVAGAQTVDDRRRRRAH